MASEATSGAANHTGRCGHGREDVFYESKGNQPLCVEPQRESA